MKRRYKAGIFSLLLFFPALTGWALSLSDVTGQVDRLPEVHTALLELEAAEQRYAISAFPGDPSLSLSPSISVKSEDGGEFAEQTQLSGSLGAALPLGLSSSRRLELQSSEAALSREQVNLEQARAEGYVKLFNFYQQAWLAQREVGVLQAEEDAARENLRVVRQRFDRGDASLSAMNTAEDELGSAENALISGTLSRRISWLELAYGVGINPANEAVLEPIEVNFPELPSPQELTAWALEHNPEAREIKDQIGADLRELEAIRGWSLAPTLGLSFSGWDQSVSISYTPESPKLSMNYSFPLATIGTDFEELNRGSSSVDTWEMGLTVSIPLQSGQSGRLEGELLETRIEQSRSRLEQLSTSLALQIRSRYQHYLLSSDAVEQARRSIELSRETLDTILSRREDQRATLADELMARAQLERAEFRYDSAVADRVEAKLFTLQTADRLDKFIRN